MFSKTFLGKRVVYAFKKCFDMLTESNKNIFVA